MLFSLLVVSIADAKIPDFLLKQKEAVVTIYVNDKNGRQVASGSGVVVGQDGIIATSCRLILKWLEETENTLSVKTNNGSYPLDTLISYNSKLDVTLFTIEATGLPAANLDGGYKTGHERDSVVRYIVKSLERYRKTVKKGKDTHDVPEKLAKLGITPEEVKPIPDGAEAFLNRGCVYEASERYIEAIDAYVQAVRMKPDFSDAYVNLGLVYYRLARYPEAIEAYQHALKLNPDSPSIWNKLGTTYVILGEYSMALDTFKKALRGDPNNPETHYHLGIAYFLSGDKDAALEEYILLQRLDEQRAENLFDLIYR